MKPRRTPTLLFALLAVALAAATSIPASGQSKSAAETAKYWILFTDKDAGLGKGPAAVEPGFVTERALERRKLRGRPTPAALDAPISTTYIDELSQLGVEPIVSSRWLNGLSAILSASQREAVENLSFVREVKSVATAVEHSASAVPVVVASSYGSQDLNYGDSASQLNAINAIEPIEEGYIGSGVMLGFLDTLTDTLHPAMKHLADNGRIVAVRNFPEEAGLGPQSNKHGLNTSSVAVGFDEGNLIGACHGAEYLFAVTEYAPTETNQEEDFFVAGIEWMERMGVDIVNVSLGYFTFDEGQRSYTYEDMDGDTAITTRAADRAAQLGVVVVTSAGNESCTAGPGSCWYYVTSPADGDSVITAGASNIPQSGATFSSVAFSGAGPTYDGRTKPDVSAPGSGVFYATSNGGYAGGGGGTSFSSPFVASVACQILQANPSLNPIDVRTILRSTAHMAANPDNKLGWGVINAKAAVDLAKIAVTSSEPEGLPDRSIAISLYPNPAVEQSLLTIEASEATGILVISLYDVLGREVIRTRPNRLGSAVSAAIDVRALPAGTYYVRVFGDHIDETRPLVVTH